MRASGLQRQNALTSAFFLKDVLANLFLRARGKQPMIPDDPRSPNANRQMRILGICWVFYGAVRLATAVWLFVFTSTATLMFGALLNRVPDPFTLMNTFHFLYGLLVAISAVCGALGVTAGIALLGGTEFSRTLAILAALLSLSNIPLGTTLGIYSLIVLLTRSPRRISAAVSGTPASSVKRQPMTM
jgi:hypothetical protein